MKEKFYKNYNVAIDTVPLPEKPNDRIELVMKSITPVINQIVRDAMSVAIGTWPTPERSKYNRLTMNEKVKKLVG